MKTFVLDKATKFTEIAMGEAVINDIDNILAEIFRRNDRNKDQLLGPTEFHMPLPSSSSSPSSANESPPGRDEL